MQKQSFSNKMYKQAVQIIRENHDYLIKDIIDKADLTAIIETAELTFKVALSDMKIHNELEQFFKRSIMNVKPIKIGDDYDYIMQGTVSFDDIDDAADFLAGCKLFIKYSSEYSICVNNGSYTFHFNIDRVDGEIYDD